MINKETIISVFDDRMTLLQFLKSVQKALHDSVLTSVEMVNTDETHAKLILHFEDGSTKETEAIELPTGFKVITDFAVDDWVAYENAHIGDLVIAVDGFIGLITKLERQTFEQVGEHISHIEITGLESNMLPTKYIGTYNGVTDTWTHEELQISGGTKLYRHEFSFSFGGPYLTFVVISKSSNQITGNQFYNVSGKTILSDANIISIFIKEPNDPYVIFTNSLAGAGSQIKLAIAGTSTIYSLSKMPTINDIVTPL